MTVNDNQCNFLHIYDASLDLLDVPVLVSSLTLLDTNDHMLLAVVLTAVPTLEAVVLTSYFSSPLVIL